MLQVAVIIIIKEWVKDQTITLENIPTQIIPVKVTTLVHKCIKKPAKTGKKSLGQLLASTSSLVVGHIKLVILLDFINRDMGGGMQHSGGMDSYGGGGGSSNYGGGGYGGSMNNPGMGAYTKSPDFGKSQ